VRPTGPFQIIVFALAKHLKIGVSRLSIATGKKSKTKTVKVL
jgi:uncharacterized protein YggU (UPF0235/DUF167 family)